MIVFLDVKANEENCVLFFIKIKTTNYERGRIDYSWVVLTARERENPQYARERERKRKTDAVLMIFVCERVFSFVCLGLFYYCYVLLLFFRKFINRNPTH